MQLNLFGFENFKKCRSCKKVKTIDCFDFENYKKNKRGYYRNNCRKCRTEYRILNYKNDINQIKYRKNYLKDWRKKNQEKNQKKRSKYEKKRYNSDNFFRIKSKVRTRIWQAFKDKGYKKHSKSENILGTDWNKLKKHIENQFTDDMSWDKFDKIHIDHRIPLAAAFTEFEVIALNHYTNLQPMWAEDNMRKSDKYDPEDFKKYMEWYRKNVKSDLV